MLYIGDIFIEPEVSSGRIKGLRFEVVDNEMETIDLLKQKYPALFEKYRYQKAADH